MLPPMSPGGDDTNDLVKDELTDGGEKSYKYWEYHKVLIVYSYRNALRHNTTRTKLLPTYPYVHCP